MQPIWLIEAGVYGAEVEPLLAEIRRQGLVGLQVPHTALKKGATLFVNDQPLADDACAIGYGTFPFARQIQLHHPWVPGSWCNPQNLDCATYYPHFARYLLNQRYTILRGVDAILQRDQLYAQFGKEDTIFARPTGCHKLFVGRRIDREDFASALAPTRYDPDTLIVVAPPKEVECEWRLVIAEERVVAASQYAVAGERALVPGCPEHVLAFAAEMLADVRWRPDPIFMLDVCASEGRLWLVELNGFSNSWLYQCDLTAVVTTASALALRLWLEKQGG